MIDEHDIREMLQRRANATLVTDVDVPQAVRGARRRLAVNGFLTTLVAAAIAVTAFAGRDVIRGTSVPADQPTPGAPSGVLRTNGEVLTFTGSSDTAGDLVAVTPGTGQTRVLAEGVEDISDAAWSADGNWVASEMQGSLWTIDRTLEARRVFSSPDHWIWSSTGARLAVIRDSEISLVDPSTGETTRLASTVGDVTSAPAWSPDGTSIVFGARGGFIYSVDVTSGERSLVADLSGGDRDSVDGIEWSPDGSQLAIYDGYDFNPGWGRLFVLNVDGSHIRVLADDDQVGGFEWSPDGTRVAFTEDYGPELRVFVDAPATPRRVTLPNPGWGDPVWSPDGSRIALGDPNALLDESTDDLVISADGSGDDAAPLDDLTYESWRGGSYDCGCDPSG